MNVRKKTLTVALLLIIAVGIFALQSKNQDLFQGKLDKIDNENAETVTDSGEGSIDSSLPDLSASLVIAAPEKTDGDLIANVTISNKGPGVISGDRPFEYTVYLNGVEVFTNTDSYTVMNVDDSFSFSYPISRAIYNYSDKGKAKVVVDEEDSIQELDEENNVSEVEYFLE